MEGRNYSVGAYADEHREMYAVQTLLFFFFPFFTWVFVILD